MSRWKPHSLAAAALLALGVACGGTGDAPSSAVRGASGGGRPAATSSPEQPRQVIPSPLAAGQGAEAIARPGAGPAPSSVPQPPPPDLGTRRPQAPPNTVSLETLHQQGRTHVLR